MTLQAASALGLDVVIAERFANSPAARLTSQSVVFNDGWDDKAALDRLAQLAPVVTLENEFVDWRVLQALEERGARVRPSPSCVGVVQDKLLQKQALARAELPVPLFGEVADPAGLIAAAEELGLAGDAQGPPRWVRRPRQCRRARRVAGRSRVRDARLAGPRPLCRSPGRVRT